MDQILQNQQLARELANTLDDQQNIGFYYTLATNEDHQFLRNIMHWVRDYRNPSNKGRLFTWKLKQEKARKITHGFEKPNEKNLHKIRELKLRKGIKGF